MTLVDTNVLLDVFTEDPKWLDWSLARLEEASFNGPVLINDVIYAETSARYPAIEDFEFALAHPRLPSVHAQRPPFARELPEPHLLEPSLAADVGLLISEFQPAALDGSLDQTRRAHVMVEAADLVSFLGQVHRPEGGEPAAGRL